MASINKLTLASLIGLSAIACSVKPKFLDPISKSTIKVNSGGLTNLNFENRGEINMDEKNDVLKFIEAYGKLPEDVLLKPDLKGIWENGHNKFLTQWKKLDYGPKINYKDHTPSLYVVPFKDFKKNKLKAYIFLDEIMKKFQISLGKESPTKIHPKFKKFKGIYYSVISANNNNLDINFSYKDSYFSLRQRMLQPSDWMTKEEFKNIIDEKFIKKSEKLSLEDKKHEEELINLKVSLMEYYLDDNNVETKKLENFSPDYEDRILNEE